MRETPNVVSIDSSGSSQFISGLLLIGSRVPGGLELHHTGKKTPSLPHIRMTVADLKVLVWMRLQMKTFMSGESLRERFNYPDR